MPVSRFFTSFTTRLKALQSKQQAAPGQSFIILMGVLLLTGLILTSLSLSSLSFQESTRNIANRTDLQLYYLAQSGLQEALGTRFAPRSNRLNWLYNAPPIPGTVAPAQLPLYPNSSFMFQNGELLGRYQYLILGGDPARLNPNNAYSTDPAVLTDSEDNFITQSFHVLSRASICVDASNNLLTDSMVSSGGAAPQPVCNAGTLRQLTIYAQTQLNHPTNPNQIVDTQVFNNAAGAVTLNNGENVTLPNGNSANVINFDTVWGDVADSYAQPTEVIFYPFADTGTAPGALTPVNPGMAPVLARATDAIRIFFRGGLDERSIYQDDYTTCVTSTNPANDCNIYIQQLDAPGGSPIGTATGLTPIAVPPAMTYVNLTPATFNAALNTAAGDDFQIVLAPDLRDSRGVPLGTQVTIPFTMSLP